MTKVNQQELIVRMVEIANRDDTTGLATDALREGAEELAAAYHDIDRQMKIANIECNRAEALLVENERLREGLANFCAARTRWLECPEVDEGEAGRLLDEAHDKARTLLGDSQP